MGIELTASRLLLAQGEPVTFRYRTDDVIDGASGMILARGEDVEIDANAYLGNYSNGQIDGKDILRDDRRAVVERLTVGGVVVRPQVGWLCDTMEGETFRVMHVRAVRKAGADAITICQLRRS